MRPQYDVVVIGSGFGGAITACRLAQAGRSVCILEKGRRWEKTEFPRSTGEVANHAFWDEEDIEQGRGFVEYKVFKNMDVIQGVGVGGGSLHYFNVHIQPPEMIFNQDPWPESITLQNLQPYYTVAREMLAAKPLTPPEGRVLPKRTDAFLSASAAIGRDDAKLIDICVYTGPDGQPSPGGQPQDACVYCGNCLIGCHVHAKNTLDLNYIPIAEQNGAEVHPLHQADYIEPLDGEEGYIVHYQRLPNDPSDGESVPGQVIGKKVIVSGGTLGSNELLLRSRDVKRTLPNISKNLGHRFSGNGDFLFAGTHYEDRQIDPGRGPAITAGVGFADGSQHIYIEDLGFPDPFMWYLNGMIPTRDKFLNRLAEGFKYLARSIGLGKFVGIDVEIERLLNGGIMTNFLPYLGMGTDAANGKITLDFSGDAYVKWNTHASRKMFNDMIDILKDMSKQSGGHFFNSFLWDIGKLLTAHPLGGCYMSDSPEEGVTNEYGEVWGYPGLYVADASVIPTALSVNPTATISALSERIAFVMIHGREMTEDDPNTPVNH